MADPIYSIRSTASTISNNARQQHPSLARRLLFPHLQPGADLPPLLLSPGCPPELNEALTRYDKEFLPQITNIVTHVIHSLERRILDADLPLLVFGDIPILITQHFRDYRQAASKVSTSYATGGALSLPQLFHQMQPHMAILPDGTIDEEYFRQMFDYILKECLPSEDYAPEAERFILREIILKVVVKDVIPRIAQPWFLQKTVLDILGPSPDASPEQVCSLIPCRLFQRLRTSSRFSKSSVIVLLLSTIQRLSGMCIMLIHAYKQVIYIIPVVNQTSCSQTRGPVQITSLDNSSRTTSPFGPPTTESKLVVSRDFTRGPLEMISEVLRVRDRLAASAMLECVSLFCCSFQTFMNKLLCYMLYTHVLSASSMLTAVRISERTLFPNGYPGPAPIDPTPEEQVVIRERLVKRIIEEIPSMAVLGDPVDGIVDALGDSACNLHLALFLVDALVLSVFPEMHRQPPNPPVLFSFPNTAQLTTALAAFVIKAQRDSIEKKGRFTIALSGGSLPKMLKALINDPAVKWDKWQVFYADERVVPLDHPDSNHHLCHTELFTHVPILPANIHTIDATLLDDLEELSDAYEKELIREFAQKDSARFPIFDLILLGVGPDGHTCSLFPGHELLKESDRWVAELDDSPKPPPKRITLTFPVLNHASRVAFVATGEGKVDTLPRILDTPEEDGLPASLVKPAHPGQAYWFVDDAASAKVVFSRATFKL
ncbi:hypothetical protein JVU11DRAFT_5469 [Chiua virens]|nr:hypothetical protein JVU11DRAFT_5469 [Chiua virens]